MIDRDRDRLRASISATLDEIQRAHKTLGLNPDWREMAEAMASVRRIENRLAALTQVTPAESP